jgi:esterase/lipase superfamily enzyme
MISDRNLSGTALGGSLSQPSFWLADNGPLDDLTNWQSVTKAAFQQALATAVNALPQITDPNEHEDQKHVTLFVHGYNNGWQQAADRYESICNSLFTGPDGMGICILFSWPSKGSPAAYLPDRSEATESAPDLADVLSEFYDWLLKMEVAAATDPTSACRAKTSMIAHSMGNFVLQKAMHTVWTRKNQPLLVSLLNQLLMVAADVDNDLFDSGETVQDTDGDAIANLTYRITALYTGRDPVLGLSAGLKHFGKRRLGRSGLDRQLPLPDNVWDVDCSSLIPDGASNIHSSYFEQPKTIELMRQILRGVDRGVLVDSGVAPPPKS